MLKIYCTDIDTNAFEEIKEFKKGSWINLTNPSEAEIKKVCENINIQEDFIRDALDFEEKARIDTEEDDSTTLFVVDVPIIEKDKEHDENDIYTTMPLGMIFVRNNIALYILSTLSSISFPLTFVPMFRLYCSYLRETQNIFSGITRRDIEIFSFRPSLYSLGFIGFGLYPSLILGIVIVPVMLYSEIKLLKFDKEK